MRLSPRLFALPLALVLILQLAGCASSGGATSGFYAQADGDEVLRYREVSENTTVTNLPLGGGERRSGLLHEATILMRFAQGDTVRAAYEDITLRASGDAGTMEPQLGALNGQPYTLLFDGRTPIVTLATPSIPENLRSISDLRWQFYDFLPTLPSEPLAVGVTWSDTISSPIHAPFSSPDETVGSRGSVRDASAVRRYEVVGGTVLMGEKAFVVETEADHRSEITAQVGGADFETKLTGRETGLMYVAAASGVVLRRERAGTMSSATRAEGPDGQPIAFGSETEFESTLTLLRESE